MIAWSLLVGALLAAFSVAEPVPQGPSAGSVQKLEITVRDENEVSVVAAKRFHLCGFSWAIRGGFNDITDHKNPAFANGDIYSPRFSDFERRAFTTRIRFLGRI